MYKLQIKPPELQTSIKRDNANFISHSCANEEMSEMKLREFKVKVTTTNSQVKKKNVDIMNI